LFILVEQASFLSQHLDVCNLFGGSGTPRNFDFAFLSPSGPVNYSHFEIYCFYVTLFLTQNFMARQIRLKL
jgi:hypothetical protein